MFSPGTEEPLSYVGMEEFTTNEIEETTRDLELLSFQDELPAKFEISAERVRSCVHYLPDDDDVRDSADALGLFETLFTVEINLDEDFCIPPKKIRHVIPCRYTVDQVKSFIFKKTSALYSLSQNDYVLGLGPAEKLNIEFVKFLRASPSIPSFIEEQKPVPLFLYLKLSEKRKRVVANRRSISSNRLFQLDHTAKPISKPCFDLRASTSGASEKDDIIPHFPEFDVSPHSSSAAAAAAAASSSSNSETSNIPTTSLQVPSKQTSRKLLVKELTLPALLPTSHQPLDVQNPPSLRRNNHSFFGSKTPREKPLNQSQKKKKEKKKKKATNVHASGSFILDGSQQIEDDGLHISENRQSHLEIDKTQGKDSIPNNNGPVFETQRKRASSLRAAKDKLVLSFPKFSPSQTTGRPSPSAAVTTSPTTTPPLTPSSSSPSSSSTPLTSSTSSLPTTTKPTGSPSVMKRLSVSLGMSLSLPRHQSPDHSTSSGGTSRVPSDLSKNDESEDVKETEKEKDKSKDKEKENRSSSVLKQRTSVYNKFLTVLGQHTSNHSHSHSQRIPEPEIELNKDIHLPPELQKTYSEDKLRGAGCPPSPLQKRILSLKHSLPTSLSMPIVSESSLTESSVSATSSNSNSSTNLFEVKKETSASSQIELSLVNEEGVSMIVLQKELSPLLAPCDGFTIEKGSASPSTVFSKENLTVLNPASDFPYYRDHFFGKPQYIWAGPSELDLIIITILAESEDLTFPYILWTRAKNKYGTVTYKKDKPSSKALLKQLLKTNPFLKKASLTLIKNDKIYDSLVQFERTQIVYNYKFGVLYVKEGQLLEEDMFSNVETSPQFNEFLELLGDRITLLNWSKYRGGLDVKNNTTGKESVFTEWEYFGIMYHVSTLLPYSLEDKQQIERKRHLGNDIVCIIFLEGNTPYNPSCISSEFIHVFIVVQPVVLEDGETRYRLSIASKVGVVPFLPALIDNALYSKSQLFRELLLFKLINAERASYEASVFASKIRRTRGQLIKNLVEPLITK